MTIPEFNALPADQLRAELTRCCGSTTWLNNMVNAFPVSSENHLLREAEANWQDCSEEDWKEAFTHHPKIGDLDALEEKFAATSTWASGEQESVKHTSRQVLEALAEINTQYEDKFGYIFIVCASGMSAEEMLSLLTLRLLNEPEHEILIAMEEQNKITQLRLKEIVIVSQITTHILDTSVGKPAANVTVVLMQGANDDWSEIARGKTNLDGRLPDLLPAGQILTTGIYKLRFETKDYYDSRAIKTFYPFVEIVFDVDTADHYHIPLLLNPFGYTTYRGS